MIMKKRALNILINLLICLVVQVFAGLLYSLTQFFVGSIIDYDIVYYFISIVFFVFINILYYVIPLKTICKSKKNIIGQSILYFIIITLVSSVLLISKLDNSIILFSLQQSIAFDTLFSSDDLFIYILLFALENMIKCFAIYKNRAKAIAAVKD